jgi:chitinase
MGNTIAPRNVVYFNNGRFPLGNIRGLPYTDVIIGFLVPHDNPDGSYTLGWDAGSFDDKFRGVVAQLKQAGKNVLVALGGGGGWSTDQWKTCANAPSVLVKQVVACVVQNGFSGVDIDFEDDNGFTGGYDGVGFLSNLSNELYQALPAGQKIITHAPQTPYWDQNWHNGPYCTIHARAGSSMAWYNNQFYSNTGYDDDDATKRNWYEKVAAVVRPEKLLMGVSLYPHNEGYVTDVDDMTRNIIKPLQGEYPAFGGVMTWQFSLDEGGAWAKGIAQALGLNQDTVS